MYTPTTIYILVRTKDVTDIPMYGSPQSNNGENGGETASPS